MQVVINTSEAPRIDWGATGVSEVVQNIFTLINTRKYEVAYDRTLGIGAEYVDMPDPQAIPLIISGIYAVVDEREPRATVEDVTFLGRDNDGDLTFQVVIDV